MTYLSRTRAIATEALRLRRWAVRRLLIGVEEDVPSASAPAWRTFLRSERCALLLQDSLGEAVSKLPSDSAAQLREMALAETMWILSARAQLHAVAKIAAAQDLRVVVLKGTADVARGRNVQVTDVDVLATPGEASKLVSLLDAAGFSRGPRDGPWHLAERGLSGAVNVEVHVAVTGFDTPGVVPWQDVRGIEKMEPLQMFAPADHVWTVLCQAMRKHPDRRTRIRDLYLVRNALAECTADEREALEVRILEDEYRKELGEMVSLAKEPDHLEPGTARVLRRLYLLQTRTVGTDPESKMGRFWRLVMEVSAAGASQDWERKQQLRDHSGIPRWSLRRLLFSAPLALLATGIGLLASSDEFLVKRVT